MHQKFNWRLITEGEYSMPHKNGNYMQRLSHEVNMVRDTSVVNVISKSLKKYQHVMVIYGGSHYSIEKKVLQDMLGSPKIYKLF